MFVNGIVKTLEKLDSLPGDEKVALMLWSPAGQGKSTIIKEFANQRGMGFVDLRLAQMEAVDVIGYPYPDLEKDGGVMSWLRPEWFPTDKQPKGILLLDELNRAHRDVRQAVFQLVLDRRANTHHLPDGWIVVACCNPNDGEYQVDELDPAFMNRFVHVSFSPDIKEWRAWSRSIEIAEEVNFFLYKHPEHLGLDGSPLPDVIVPTPRGYELLSNLIRGETDAVWIQDIASGLIGPTAAAAFMLCRNEEDQPFSADEMMNGWKDKPIEARLKKFLAGKRDDILNTSADNLLSFIERTAAENAAKPKAEQFKWSAKQKKNIQSVIKKFPEEVAYRMLKEWCDAPTGETQEHQSLGYDAVKDDDDIVDMVQEIHTGIEKAGVNK